VPTLTHVSPAAPIVAPNQAVTFTGENFQEKIAVTFTDPQGNTHPGQVVSQNGKSLVVIASFGLAGTWQATAANPGGADSAKLEFPVANSLDPYFYWRFGSFAFACFVATVVLGGLFIIIFWWLSKANWSLAEALSEESTCQPSEIQDRTDVVLLPSSSRLIALLGLMGILTIILGVGYAIIWSLFMGGTVPDLTGLRTFLFGAACLFAPYLANQLSSVFTPQVPSAPAPAPAANAPAMSITGIAPAAPQADAANPLTLHLTGTGFVTGLTLTFTDPAGAQTTVAGPGITSVDPTLIVCPVLLAVPGSWKVSVQNAAGGAASDVFEFTVAGAPTVTGTNRVLTHDAANDQSWSFIGTGFVSPLIVNLTPPPPLGGGAAPASFAATVTSVASQEAKVTAKLTVGGTWQVVAINPGNQASAVYNMNVN
jgi:hypothetical protein